jgi:trehalose synthase
MYLREVEVRPLEPHRFAPVIGPERMAAFDATADAARGFLGGRRVININSTATGGGVAELLQTLLAYARGVGIDARWFVIEGNPAFFAITKRIHNHLYGGPGDGGPLGDDERRHYERTLDASVAPLQAIAREGDIVLLHDPQTAALVPAAKDAGALVVWRCHVGIDTPNEWSECAWRFLRPYVELADAFVFSRDRFAPEWVPRDRLAIVAPSIDPFSAKNEPIDPEGVLATLQRAGLLDGPPHWTPPPFTRRDGSHGRVERVADLAGTGPPPPPDVPLVLQASRWDAMKDMLGVMVGFAEHVVPGEDAHLVLAGPASSGVADDPESGRVLAECLAAWQGLPARARERIHLTCVPMHDPDEAAAIVNALQRRASVVVQKSIAEGFGLTVAEAMWKARAVVASNVGGIADQIVSGDSGLLIDDPHDLAAYGAAVRSLLDHPPEAARIGEHAQRRAAEHFLGDRHLREWAHLFSQLL